MNIKSILVIGILFLLIFITACSKDDAIIIRPEQNESDTTIPVNLEGIQKGDLVEMNFVLYGEDGRVIDTNNKEIAEKAKLNTYSTGVYKLLVGKSGKVKGFDEALIRLEKGDKETLTIQPTEEKIEIEFERETTKSRIRTVPRKQKFSLKNFEEIFLKPPIAGDVISNRDMFPWPYKILAITNNSVLGEIIIKQGEEAQLPGTQWKSKATLISDLAIQFLQMPKQGQIIETEFGTAVIDVKTSRMKTTHNPIMGKEFFYTLPSEQIISPRYEFTVSEIKDDTFKIIRINYPQQETLKLEVEILSVMPGEEIRKVKIAS